MESRYKLVPNTDELYLTKPVQVTTVLIKMPGNSFECVSESRADLSSTPITGQETREATRPITDEEPVTDLLTQMDVNMNDQPRRKGTDNEPLRCRKPHCQLSKNEHYQNIFKLCLEDQSSTLLHKPRKINRDLYETFEEFFYPKTNDKSDHETTKVGKMTYCISWSEQPASEGRCNPTHHLPRRQIVSCYDKHNMLYPSGILNAFVMPLEKCKTKRELSYKPPKNTSRKEDKRTNVEEKEKLDGVQKDLDNNVI